MAKINSRKTFYGCGSFDVKYTPDKRGGRARVPVCRLHAIRLVWRMGRRYRQWVCPKCSPKIKLTSTAQMAGKRKKRQKRYETRPK